MCAVLADRLDRRRDAGAIDEAHQLAQARGLSHRSVAVVFLADVALDERAAELLRHRLALVDLQIGDHDFAAVLREHARRTFAEPDAPPVTMKTLPAISMEYLSSMPSNARALISSTLPVPEILR